MHLNLKSLLISLLSCTMLVQVAAFPILPPNALIQLKVYSAAGALVPIHLSRRALELSPVSARSNTNPEKHEADEQKDKASAEQKEAKEKENLEKAKAADAKGDKAQADKERTKAAQEEAKEQTAKSHADAAEKKEQAAKAGEAKGKPGH